MVLAFTSLRGKSQTNFSCRAPLPAGRLPCFRHPLLMCFLQLSRRTTANFSYLKEFRRNGNSRLGCCLCQQDLRDVSPISWVVGVHGRPTASSCCSHVALRFLSDTPMGPMRTNWWICPVRHFM